MERPRFPDDQQDAGSPHGYGSAHGGWVLSREDKEDIRKLMEDDVTVTCYHHISFPDCRDASAWI